MKIEHLAIWADDIELLRAFYMKYFNLRCGDRYINPIKNFTSYFLFFELHIIKSFVLTIFNRHKLIMISEFYKLTFVYNCNFICVSYRLTCQTRDTFSQNP